MSEFDKKISALTSGSDSQAADEYVIARGGSNYKITGANIAAAATKLGTIATGVWQGTAIANAYIATGLDVTKLTTGATLPSNVLASSLTSVGTLSSLTVSGVTTLSAGTASAPALTTSGDTNNGIYFPAADVTAITTGGTERLRVDASGNLGLGVTPSAWNTNYKAIQVKNASLYQGAATDEATISANGFVDAVGDKYIATNFASKYTQYNGKHMFFTAPSGTAGNAITFTQAMTLDASGNLGVGVTSAGRPLHVHKTDGAASVVQFTNADTGSGSTDGLLVGITGAEDACIIMQENKPLYFATNDTERARITSGGYFKASNDGAYVSSTGAYHEVDQSADNHGLIVNATNASQTATAHLVRVARNTTNNSFYAIEYYNTGAAASKFVVADSGNVTNTNNSYGAISDEKVKQDIVDAASQWDDIKGLRVRKFRYKNAPDAPLQIGLVAQEAELVSPGIVDEAPDYEEIEVTDEDGNVTTERQATGTVTKSVKYSVLYMKSVKALQEAMTRIEALEARLEALEA